MGEKRPLLAEKVEFSRDPEVWVPIVKRVTLQWFYRNLGMVSLPMGMEVISQSIDILCKREGMGSWEWLLEGRALAWRNVPIDNAAKIDAYVVGSKRRQKNVLFVRNQFWKMWFMQSALSTLDKSIPGRILAVI